MNRKLTGMIRKEIFHILRDKQTLMITILLPVIMLLLYGYALTLDLKDINTRIIDYDKTQISRNFSTKFKAAKFFKTEEITSISINDIAHNMRSNKVKLFIVIPSGFSRSLSSGKKSNVKIYIDGADPNTANLILFYTQAFARLFSEDNSQPLLKLEPRFLYNENLAPPFFFVPGLVAFIMIMLSALLTAITVSRELETGTMEQLLASPLKPYEIILGKTIPYLLVAMTAEIFIIVLGLILFDLPFKGSIILLLIVSLFFLTASLAIGLLSSMTSSSQQEGMFKALMLTLLPTLILSGFIFPLESMYSIFRVLSNVIPATYFVTIIRGILLKGNDITILYPSILGLALISFLLMAASVSKFKIYLRN